MILSVIGEDALEIFDGMDFTPETDNQVLNKVVEFNAATLYWMKRQGSCK